MRSEALASHFEMAIKVVWKSPQGKERGELYTNLDSVFETQNLERGAYTSTISIVSRSWIMDEVCPKKRILRFLHVD
jgi:hypothetical protein